VELIERIAAAFPDRGVPPEASIVTFDGWDQLDKESAVRAFAGKTREQIDALIGKGPRGFEGLWGIEELEMLEPPALQYYVAPFLRVMVVHQSSEPDDFSHFLAYQLSEILKRRGSSAFTEEQRELLADIASHFVVLVNGTDEWAASHRAHLEAIRSTIRDGLPGEAE
jgi:hypothetical protein